MLQPTGAPLLQFALPVDPTEHQCAVPEAIVQQVMDHDHRVRVGAGKQFRAALTTVRIQRGQKRKMHAVQVICE